MGCPGWTWDDVLPVYMRMEDFDRGASDWHGAGGAIRVKNDYPRIALHEAVIAAGGECGIPFNDDYNGPGGQDGFSWCQLTIDREGVRHSSACAYLASVMDDPRLMVITGAHARRLLIDAGRCCGVEWERDGRIECGYAEAEVIVSAGTIESPRLLMLSGIGPAAHLASVGIDVVHDLPGVGENLQDHLLSPVIFSAERAIPAPEPGCQQAQAHFFWRSRPGLAVPDVQPLVFSVPLYEEWMEGPENAFSLMAGMIRPASRGTIRLRSADPWDEIDIDPRILSADADFQTLVTAVGKCREIGAAPALREWGARELYPGPDADIGAWVRRTAITYHHQVGTCRMGSDALAVVDPELRVRGIDGLRVADASIMPTVTTGNTNAPSLMIGERVADFVLGGRAAALPAVAAA
jgi:choline dehydrogenase